MAGGLLPCGMCLHVFGTPEIKIPSTQQRKKYAKWGFQEYHSFIFFCYAVYKKGCLSIFGRETQTPGASFTRFCSGAERRFCAPEYIICSRHVLLFVCTCTDRPHTAYPMSPYPFLFPCSFAHLFLLLLPTTRHPPPTTPLHDHTTPQQHTYYILPTLLTQRVSLLQTAASKAFKISDTGHRFAKMILRAAVLLLGSALVNGIDECLEISSAVTCDHIPRYTASGCQCACDWIATFKDSQTMMVIVLPDGPGSTTPCKPGCCNPNSEAGGDWCYPAANDFNTQRGCGTARETCLAAGAVPATGGVTPRAAIPGVPSDQNNVCTDGGQLCVDPNTVSTEDWQCQCVSPKTGTPGQQALATCVATTIAPTDAPATNVPPPTGKNECEEISAAVTCNHKPRYTASGCQCACDWIATFKDSQTMMVIVLPDGPGSTTPCAGGCCNPNSEAGGDWCYPAANDFNTQRGCSTARETCLAAGAVPATGGVTPRATIPGIPDSQNNICTDGGQICVDPNNMTDNDWQCQCVSPKTGTPGQQALATCVATTIAPTDAPATNVPPPTGKNECEEISSAVTCNHKPRYTASGCQCACDWIATFKDSQTMMVIVLPDGPGSTTPCAGGCCNPNSEAGGDWCYPAANDFNTQRGCSTARETCLAAGAVPATGGVTPRPTIPGIPDSQNNICTDGGQICVDPNSMTDNDWQCQCVSPKTGTPGQQALATCVDVTIAPTDAPATDAPATNAPPPPGKNECEEISAAVTCNHKPRYTASGCQCACDWIATFKDSQTMMVIVLPDGPGSTTPCAGGCCNPNSEAGGDWCYPARNDFNTQRGCSTSRETCLAAGAVPATGGVTPRPTVPGIPDSQNNICTDGGQICVDPDNMTDNDWQCTCVAPKTGTPGQQALATCVDVTLAPTDAPATNVPPPATKNECEEISSAVTCNHKPRYTASGCQCACDWIATFKDGNGMVIVYPDGPGSTTPCAGGCCNPNSEATGDWCYLAANDFNTQRGCSTSRETCLAAGAVPATGGVPPRATIPGIPDTQNNICTDAEQICEDPDLTTDDNWVCKCVAPKVGTPGQQQVAVCGAPPTAAPTNPPATDAPATNPPDTAAPTAVPTDAPATDVPPPPTKNECEEISDAVTCNHVPRYTASGCQCACDWIATFKDFNGMVIVYPDGPGSTTPCAGGCCNPNSEAAGDWCYPARNDFNTQRGCSTSRETCLAAGAVPATGGVPPRATIPGIPDSQNNICTDAEQICEDPDQTVDGDWVCKCVAPKTGTGPQQVAVCALDECEEGTPPNKDTCTGAMQTCRDPDTSTTGNWECVCPAPRSSVSATMAVADCSHNECTEQDVVCKMKGQLCVDTDLNAPDTWQCECIAPQMGTTVKLGVAVCTDPPGDCEVNGKTCEAAGQSCKDTVLPLDNQFECECIAPATQTKVGTNAAAECAIDECTVTCATCAKKDAMSDNVCTAANQDCEDPNTDALSLGNWVCKCRLPFSGQNTIAAADCTLDECQVKCPTCADKDDMKGNVCDGAGQTCVEPSTSVSGDWECVCVDPKVGRMLTGVATCTENECIANGAVCDAASQVCVDTDQTTPNNWQCECASPSTTVKVGGVATCEVNECTLAVNKQKCEDVSQVCVDPSTTTLDDWECQCVAPQTGSQKLGAVVPCNLDECVAVCPSCAKTDMASANVCEAADQVCHDPVTTATDLGTWTCTCKTSAKFATSAAVAQCIDGKNECEELSDAVTCTHVPRYTSDGCQCACDWTATFKDGNGNVIVMPPGPGSTEECKAGCCNPESHPSGDWCYLAVNDYNTKKGCTARRNFCSAAGTIPADGGAKIIRDPIPGVPSDVNNVCTDKGQICEDPDNLVTNNWVCKCVAPMTGTAQQAPVTTCEKDECTEHGAVCTAANQICKDADKTTDNNWVCECVTGGTPTTGGPAVCPLNECEETCPTCAQVNGVDVCTSAGQTCTDPTPDTSSLDDWMCVCTAPATTTGGRGGAAVCTIDECVATCPTCAQGLCAKNGQTCEDPDTGISKLGDWMCKCPPPSTTTAQANAAVCAKDECVEHGSKCAAGQVCVDPDQLTSGNWFCECQPPTVGSQAGGPATCTDDECKENTICDVAGQTCKDTDTTTPNNWICECIAPDTGVAGMQAAATCTPPDVCVDQGGDVKCAQAKQHCVQKSATEYECACIAPYAGVPVVGAPATCIMDECLATCPSCEADLCKLHDQDCVDTDTTTNGNWECACKAPSTGTPVKGAAAVCLIDECVATCPSCEADVCTAAGQTCTDPDTSATSLSNWMCVCAAPSTTTRTTAVVAECVYDECSDAANTKKCTDATQTCVDPTPTLASKNDWTCQCPPPSSGSAVQGPAAVCTLNECAAVCATCADTGSGNVCTGADQDCVDPSQSVTNDWYCKCKIGGSTQVGAYVMKCIVDECVTKCDTCADKGAGNICTALGQECVDTNTDPWQTNDWSCRCPAPFQHIMQQGNAAVCSADECVDVLTGATSPNGKICTDAGQVCHDSHLSTTGDFDCLCVAPDQGSKTGGVATCTTNECLIHGDECKLAMQTCVDSDVSTLNTWQCVCPPPSSNVKKLGAAVCEVDECVDNRAVCEQAVPAQTCLDSDLTTTDTWQCVCAPPSTGTGVKTAAVCLMDECVSTCVSCSNNACKAAGQTCYDPNPKASSLWDWECRCPAPSTQVSVGKAAVCAVDECDRARFVCAASSQTCIDPNTSPDSLSDWECHCQDPASGKETKGPAVCIVDECKTHGHVCSNIGQVCLDEDKRETSLNNWVCQCSPPLHQNAVGNQAPAECVMVGECDDLTNSDVCTSKGQICNDPDTATAGDWSCLCVVPATGAPVVGGAAVCVLDECTAQCATCAGTTCSDAKQTCVDADKNPITGLSSWECRCIEPASGVQRAAAATCVTDECKTHRSTCSGAGQDCVDDNTAIEGDWRCVCQTPAVGSATANAARCKVDECVIHKSECELVGQTCLDPNQDGSSLSDWQCFCTAPATGSATAKPAVCEVDECTLYGDTCVGAGQTCEDIEKTIDGHWKCTCPPPNQKVTRTTGAADCSIDECKVFLPGTAVTVENEDNVCVKAGQTCIDSNTDYTSLGDWACQCPGSTQVAIGNPAVCETDECLDATNSDKCPTGQTCVDKGFTTEGDWECVCTPPAVGSTVAGATTCVLDECVTNEQTCHNAGQVCEDPATTETSTGDWECHCAPNAGVTASAVASTAVCTPPPTSECADAVVNALCTAAGQVCVDPDTSEQGNWQCECLPPATGTVTVMGITTCTLDECSATCSTCEGGMCAAAGQLCVDPNTDASSLHDWICRCPSGQAGQETAAIASCMLDECAEVCISCADSGNGQGNACTATNTLCHDPNQDVRSRSDWMCICKPPATGNRTLAIPVCRVDECVRLDTQDPVCGEGQTCSDPDMDPTSTGDFLCTCPVGQTGTGKGVPAQCILNECNIQENFNICNTAGQVCIDPKPTPTSTGDWECHCAAGDIFSVRKAADCVLDECTQVCDTCANKGAGNLCTQAGQGCTDPVTTATSTGDWMCSCPGGGAMATRAVAVCEMDECAEVTNFGAVGCEQVPRETVNGCACKCNWQEPLLALVVGSGPGVDSPCTAGCCNPTTQAGAYCIIEDSEDNRKKGCPVDGTLQERIQMCVAPPAGAAAAAAAAVCGAGQTCVDSSKAAKSQGDWRCECNAPSFGESAAGKPAVCITDECTDVNVCASVGQTCFDTNTESGSVGDWKCICPKGASGEAAMSTATCDWTGECAENAKVCTQVGQTCYDPDVMVVGDWVCQCVEPSSGVSTTGGPALCQLDECTSQCATCADKGAGNVCEQNKQRCEETSLSPSDVKDWRCVCPTGLTGSATAAAVVQCMVDECEANGGLNEGVCGVAGQSCLDANTSVTGDWRCECPSPSVGTATGRVANCLWDECLETTKASICTAAGQLCVDPNTDITSKNDWMCVCPETPTERGTTGAPATCPGGSWCQTYGSTCTARGQMCVPKGTQGRCECVMPQTGPEMPFTSDFPADSLNCILDECLATCVTCARTAGGSKTVCEAASGPAQVCVEGSTSPTSTKDWECQCVGSTVSAKGAVAVCTTNECDTAAGSVCEKAEQACVDPDTTTEGDWYCECHTPYVGKVVNGVAVCTYDECVVHGKQCQSAGQTCFDDNLAAESTGDWSCSCPAPSTGTAVAGVAVCAFVGECDDKSNSDICTNMGQTCVDPNVETPGDWTCVCVSPQTGTPKKTAPATCELDECTVPCATCAMLPGSSKHACLSAGQDCEDANKDPISTGDWWCKCKAPGLGTQRAAAAVCPIDECTILENANVCSGVITAGKNSQMCVDDDLSLLGSWECQCAWPYTGKSGVGEAAKCLIDECIVPKEWNNGQDNGNTICSAAGQRCVDSKQDVDSLGNWVCQCEDPSEGSAIAKPADMCTVSTLCVTNGAACGPQQLCKEKDNAWYCECNTPLVGEALNGPAVCVLDECVARCDTCAQQGMTHTCGDQSCVDKDTSPESVGDWSCVCQQGTGSAVGAAAVCDVDECVVHAVACEAVGQMCEDPNQDSSSMGDWMCVCLAPASGASTGGTASCLLDECDTKSTVCAAVGQICIDQSTSPTSLGDWSCLCPEGAVGSMIGGVATCTYTGGCADSANQQVCASAGQKCVPGETGESSDWRCACIAPFHGETGSKAATVCTVNECTDICPTCARTSQESVNVCAGEGQDCVDPNFSASSLSDWMCVCQAPATATAVAMPVASCTIDECEAVTNTGARQCGHFRRYTTEGCECACGWQASLVGGGLLGTGPGFSEPCNTACCNPERAVTGDWCFVADSDWNKGIDTCRAQIRERQTCTSVLTPAPVGAPAVAYNNVCAEKNQICVDLDTTPSLLGNWECRCPSSEGKQALAPVPLCEHNECVNVTTCMDAGQTCRDTNTAPDSLNDWECVCPGTNETARGAVAVCSMFPLLPLPSSLPLPLAGMAGSPTSSCCPCSAFLKKQTSSPYCYFHTHTHPHRPCRRVCGPQGQMSCGTALLRPEPRGRLDRRLGVPLL